ncbi:YtpI family protein [Laceyella putida]|uniref:YtpI family protein n=1 Tax=Laceyella putida TaxID=110101 RepID=A0ABW2RPC8_9BACL
MQAIGIILVSVICVSIFGTFFNSVLSRRNEGIFKRIYQARMNMHMGLMFLAIGSLQFLMPSGSGLRLFFICLILAVGLFNLYYGLKHHRFYSNQVKQNKEQTSPVS